MTVLTPDAARTRRGRLMLIALFLLFFGTAFGAMLLRLSGWMPAGLKNHGELLQPPADLRKAAPLLADGSRYDWNPEARTWRIVVAPPPACTVECERLLAELDKVWQLFGHNADKVEILWLGSLPEGAPALPELRPLRDDAALRAALPQLDDPAGIPLYVVDPNGFVILRYPPHADPVGMRADIAKLLKLK
ncbi:hypothetical protein MNQ95_05450 [Pseudoxanthomonas daejeonensis]|uniref:hypothetical protein n=1 Tax=Pseudoxanthomonas daejeonensis TaxID=266062 RepID=UPI001F54382A|nr:hypothetical protein [Pseudoxanthomonas daejeonensis]UNK58535.1 hypothetical protein MNQ95_05450 [Pseudoxanthomonas daejeonensis]